MAYGFYDDKSKCDLDNYLDDFAEEKYITRDYSNTALSWVANTNSGTPTGNMSKNITVDGYTPIAHSIIKLGHASAYFFVPVITNDTLTFYFYRANTSAYNLAANDVIVRVLYKKD